MAAAAAPATPETQAFRREFVEFAIRAGVLRFGEFKTKAGRLSPYFFNAGLFDDGRKLGELARYYAQAALASGIQFDVIFGPAYKGITLAAATAMALAGLGHNVPFCFNRKEAKDHGEGGNIVGAPLKGRALIIDDVITDGGGQARGDRADPRRRGGAGWNTNCSGPSGAGPGRAFGDPGGQPGLRRARYCHCHARRHPGHPSGAAGPAGERGTHRGLQAPIRRGMTRGRTRGREDQRT